MSGVDECTSAAPKDPGAHLTQNRHTVQNTVAILNLLINSPPHTEVESRRIERVHEPRYSQLFLMEARKKERKKEGESERQGPNGGSHHRRPGPKH